MLPSGHRTGQLHSAAVKQQFLSQRRLARIRVRNDGKRATLEYLVRYIHKGGEVSRIKSRNKYEPWRIVS